MVKLPDGFKLPKRLDGSLVATIGGLLVAIYLAVLLGQTVKRNYDLGKQITTLQVQIDTLQQQNQQLSFNLQYYQTDSFAEREARAKLGLQKPGESVIILPPKSTQSPSSSVSKGKLDKRTNPRKWLDFLLGRS